ncbi:MAG: rhodanese-like domain-containing protein [Gammaproteobacteria bacterium]|nr:rhodanese-like domain-containing protein [Gammaproteobacteria bacterium]
MFRRSRPFVIAIVWVMVLTLPARAENGVPYPDEIPGTTKVDAEGILDLVDKIPQLVIVDARIRQDRLQGYIEGSISLPDIETDCKSLAKVIPGKTAPVVFYCNGPKCGRSVKSSRKALDCGYTRVYWFHGGFEEWMHKNYPYLKK